MLCILRTTLLDLNSERAFRVFSVFFSKKRHVPRSIVKFASVRDFYAYPWLFFQKKLDLLLRGNKLRKYWYRCLHERSNSDRARCYPKHVCGRVNGTGERMAKQTTHSRCFFTIEETDRRQSRYRSSLLATCSYSRASRHVIPLSAFAYFILKELRCEIHRYRVTADISIWRMSKNSNTMCIVRAAVYGVLKFSPHLFSENSVYTSAVYFENDVSDVSDWSACMFWRYLNFKLKS